MSEIMTIKEVSAYLKIHPSTTYRLLKRHRLPAFKIGSDWRFALEQVDAWRQSLQTAMRGASNGHAEPPKP